MDTSRRKFIVGLGTIIAAPAIVRASSLMKVKPIYDWTCLYNVPSDAPWFAVHGTDAQGHKVVEYVRGEHAFYGNGHFIDAGGIQTPFAHIDRVRSIDGRTAALLVAADAPFAAVQLGRG